MKLQVSAQEAFETSALIGRNWKVEQHNLGHKAECYEGGSGSMVAWTTYCAPTNDNHYGGPLAASLKRG
eukprot:385297-Pelagomonas_calceolata.AAC.3